MLESTKPETEKSEPTATNKKQRSGCGCLFVVLLLIAVVYAFSGASSRVSDAINSEYGRICKASIEGFFSNTLRVDWTSNTKMIDTAVVLAAIGKSKDNLFSQGVRYFKFPNDAGTYNVIDWKTGERWAVDERAPYYFRK